MTTFSKTVGYTAAAVAGVVLSSVFITGVFLLLQLVRSL